jgi:methylated-DNA-protein-cysteine methyltransferase-like protein
MQAYTRAVIEIIKRIPEGRVCTYGRIGLMAGQPNGARQVARIIHSMSRKHDLPWHRIVNAKGFISLPRARGYDRQKTLLQGEGVQFDENDWIDLNKYLWTEQPFLKSPS